MASARHSMGASRVNSALFDLKSHHASMTLQVNEHGGAFNALHLLESAFCVMLVPVD